MPKENKNSQSGTEKSAEIKSALKKIEKAQPKRKGKSCLKAFLIFLVILLILAGIGYLLFFGSFALPGTALKGEWSGQINILVLGRGGEGHSGENLTDTIMLAMIKPSKKKMALLSIPRDLYVKTPGYGWSKINAVYSNALQKEGHDGALKLLYNHIEEITSFKPQYYALMDFTGFKDIVDTLGGVDVNVENEFYDNLHKVTFKKGINHMDGQKALVYTRSRYSTNGEGTDFKRAERQQNLLIAIKDKVMTKDTLFNPSTLSSLMGEYKENVQTDISIRELSRLRILAGDLKDESIIDEVYSTDNVLVSSRADGAYILKTRTGDYTETQAMAKNLFNDKPTVRILNGSKDTAKTKPVRKNLLAGGYNVLNDGFAKNKFHIQNIVYDNSDGKCKSFAEELARRFKTTLL